MDRTIPVVWREGQDVWLLRNAPPADLRSVPEWSFNVQRFEKVLNRRRHTLSTPFQPRKRRRL